MSNKYDYHLLVIPEDDANRQIVTGFNNHLGVQNRRIHVEPLTGGWMEALETFKSDHIKGMNDYGKRHILILIDFDNHPERLEWAKEKYIPGNLADRVFILGCLSEPEKVREATGLSKEKLGEALAEACLRNEDGFWQSAILAHNQAELQRMRITICPHLRA